MNTLHHSLRALRHRNFRLYFAGHAISTLGTWIQQVALAWLIYRLSGSAALLGLTTCVALLPQLIVGPLASRLAVDSLPATILAAGAATALALLVFAGSDILALSLIVMA